MEHRREMNLFEMLVTFFNWLKKLLTGLLRLLATTLKLTYHYAWMVAIVTVLFLACGLYLSRPTKQLYKGSTTILFSPDLRQYVQNGFEQLNSYCLAEPERLADALQIDDTLACRIRSIQTYPVIDLKNDSIPDFVDYDRTANFGTDTFNVVMPDRFGVKVAIRQSPDFMPIQQGIKRYFETQADFTRVNEASKALLLERIAFCNKELQRLDSLSNYDYFGEEKRMSMHLNGAVIRFEPSRYKLFYENMRDLLNEKQRLGYELAMYPDGVSFTTENMVVQTFLRLYKLALWTLVGYLFGVLCAWGFKRRKKVKTFFSEE
ncbi:MAG: hypothetical protein LBS16_03145 [Prevotellaceae bacterium]|jgi:hypothetical protein|nr:hypothetical protein [Prevotellaceae bacterium]